MVRVLPRLDTSYDIADSNMKSSKASTFANSENKISVDYLFNLKLYFFKWVLRLSTGSF